MHKHNPPVNRAAVPVLVGLCLLFVMLLAGRFIFVDRESSSSNELNLDLSSSAASSTSSSLTYVHKNVRRRVGTYQGIEAAFKNLGILPTDLIKFPGSCANSSTDRIGGRGPEAVRTLVLDEIFDGVSPFEDFPSEAVRPLLKKRMRLRGWGSNNSVFERLIREVRPHLIIEVGSFLGASAINMALKAQELGLDPVTILCLDDFRGWPGFRNSFRQIKHVNGDAVLLQYFMKNVVEAGQEKVILPLPFSTAHSLKALCDWGVQADLVEVDAGHDFHSAWLDINLAYRLLRPGGVMFGHDYFSKADNSGVRRAITLFATLRGMWVEPDGEHWILRQGPAAPGMAAVQGASVSATEPDVTKEEEDNEN
ncbi:unnamed protein product [Closterium sp. Yama58-4]|nr:unnamed protein product [Closterium sp. Yama58-4]